MLSRSAGRPDGLTLTSMWGRQYAVSTHCTYVERFRSPSCTLVGFQSRWPADTGLHCALPTLVIGGRSRSPTTWAAPLAHMHVFVKPHLNTCGFAVTNIATLMHHTLVTRAPKRLQIVLRSRQRPASLLISGTILGKHLAAKRPFQRSSTSVVKDL